MSDAKYNGVVASLSSEEYHNHGGTYSSTQLKDLLEDPEIFHRKYIAKTLKRTTVPAFEVGSYFHTGVLEPDKMKVDTAVYSGIRRGEEWEAFQLQNKGKAIITRAEKDQAEGIIAAVKNSPVAMNRISRGKPEVSAFVTVSVSGGQVFTEGGDKMLTPHGWEKPTYKFDKKNKVDIPLKVRADLLARDFILDLKSTTGNVKSESLMKKKVAEYSYDLSAALYLDMFTIALNYRLNEFVWVFASKDLFNCKSYIATQSNIQVGRAKYKKALLTLADCIKTNWAFEDSMGMLGPNAWDLEYLKPRNEELL